MEYITQLKINKLSKMYNYFEGNTAIKLLTSMSEKEKEIVFSSPVVQKTILRIDDTDVLRTIFKYSPAFFQEIMFFNDNIQGLLLTPKKSLKRKELFENYNKRDYLFSEYNIRELEAFLHSIKSSKIYEQLAENKFFQMIIALCYEKQLNRSFFRGIDEVKLFYSMVNDDEIFKTRKPRRRSIIKIFNKVSDHFLLPDDYAKIISDPKKIISDKRWNSEGFEKIYIDERTLSILPTDLIEELFCFKNIDKQFIIDFLEKNIMVSLKKHDNDFNKLFPHLLKGDYECFNDVDYICFNTIIRECEKNNELKEQFINFVYKLLCNTEDLDETETEIVKNALYYRMKTGSIPKEDYQKLFYSPDALKTLFYLKFGKTSSRMDYLNGIALQQIMQLNIKHINQILKFLHNDNEDELSSLYSYAIRLYLTFGLERTMKILDGDYGSLNRTFFDNVSALKIDKVKLIKEGNKYLPEISNEFINFMFANQNDNHFINMLNNPDCELSKHWSYLYNNFDEIKEKCHGTITLKKLNIILKQLSPSRDINDVSPDNYRLRENDILNDICLGNKTNLSNGEVYKSVLDIYEQMKRRTESSIPYVKGNCSNGYSYEMMRLNDPIVFTLGYKGNCCIRTQDIAHAHLLHATLCRNGRILIIYNENNEIAGFVPLKRNGEVLIANSIECTHKIRNENTINAFSEAVNEIVNVSQNNKEEENPINLVCIGTEAYAKPRGVLFPASIKTPTIYEKNDPKYSMTDQYHTKLTIIYKNPALDLTNIKYGNPKCSYQDPRPMVTTCDFMRSTNEEQEKALKVINAVRYTNAELEELENFRQCGKYGISYCVYSDDWYIFRTYDGKIHADCLKYDERAFDEYNKALEIFKKEFNDGQQQRGQSLVKRLYNTSQ